MDYLILKSSHASIAYVSGLLFVLRFWLFYFSPKAKQFKPLKVLPHIIDTLLLASAIYLLIMLSISPLVHTWVLAKIMALFAYIGLGMIAIRKQKVWAFWVSASLYLYIIGAAHQHNSLSWVSVVF